MKTTRPRMIMKIVGYTAIVLFMFFTSCKDNETISFSDEDNSNLQSEASSEAYMEEMSDMATLAVLADDGTFDGGKQGGSGSRPIVINDARFNCGATITLEFAPDNLPNPNQIHGYITIDFGDDGCTGPFGRVRKGQITIEFKGRRFLPGSFIRISTDNYSIDGIGIIGFRKETNSTASNESNPAFTIEEDVEVTFLNGETATRNSTRTRTWIRAANPLNDTWTVTGIASGTTRKQREYAMEITKPLVFSRACAIQSKAIIPIEGTKELVVNGKKITIDFGSGECDTKITITVNGKSKEIEVSANGD